VFFNDIISTAGRIYGRTDGTIKFAELVRIGEQEVVSSFKMGLLFRHSPEETEENHRIGSVRSGFSTQGQLISFMTCL
jgi:hypothetical protein